MPPLRSTGDTGREALGEDLGREDLGPEGIGPEENCPEQIGPEEIGREVMGREGLGRAGLGRADVSRVGNDPEYAGEYRLGAVLGSGGMGIVRLARSASGLRLAIKIVHKSYASDPEFRARFRQEVAAARRVSGAFTAPVVDADPDAPRPWMATLYVPGPTLSEQVKRNGPLTPAELRRLTAGLAEALRDIHRAGVVHRDLKPGNVLLTDGGPKVIDFGISRPVDSDLRTETGKLIGSPPFMAPEQFQRPRQVGPAADVFALGSVLVHAATGRGPFDSDSPYIVAYQVVHDEPDLTGVPAELAPLVARCLAKEPEDRPTPDEITAALLPPSYEAAAFVPAQRRRTGAAPGARTGPGAGAGTAEDSATRALWAAAGRVGGGLADTGAGSAAATASGTDTMGTVEVAAPSRARTARRRRRPLTVVAVAVLATLLAGGALAVRHSGTGGGKDRSQQAAATRPLDTWRTALPAVGTSAPACAAADGALFCATRGTTAVARLDTGTGKILWSRPPATTAAAESVAAPVVAGGRLGTIGGDRYTTFDPDTGRPGWSTDVSGYLADASAFAAGDALLFPDASGTVTALDAATGRRLWRHALRGHSMPHFGPYDPATGLVHFFEESDDGTRTLISSVRAASGELVHQRRLPGQLVPGAVGTDGTLFLTSQGFQGMTDAVVRYDVARGTTRRAALPFRLGEPRIAVRGDAVYLLDATGALVAVDTAGTADRKSHELWQLETAAGRVSAPVVGTGGRLFFSAADGRVLAVDTTRGVVLGQTEPRLHDGKLGFAGSVPAPVAVGDRVYGTAPDGSVFAVDGRTPAEW